MSSQGHSSTNYKQYTKEEHNKHLSSICSSHSQPITRNNQDPMDPIDEQRKMMANATEIIHIPPKFQRFKSSLDLPQAAAAIIRRSSSTTRTLVQRPDTGQYYIELNTQNSSNTTKNGQDTSLPPPDSTST